MIFQSESLLNSEMGNKDKDKEQNSDIAMGEGADSAHDAHHTSCDLSQERAAALGKLVAEAIARETAGITAMFSLCFFISTFTCLLIIS